MGAAAVEGFEAAGVVSVAKHFPNHGAASSDSHRTLPVVDHDLATLRSHDLPPFEAAVAAGGAVGVGGDLPLPAQKPPRAPRLSPQGGGGGRRGIRFSG